MYHYRLTRQVGQRNGFENTLREIEIQTSSKVPLTEIRKGKVRVGGHVWRVKECTKEGE